MSGKLHRRQFIKTTAAANIRDLHATMLHLLGIGHSLFTVKHQGLDMRLTGAEPARVVKDILV